MLAFQIMRQYLIDEISPDDYTKIKAYLDKYYLEGSMNGVYWVCLDSTLLTALQSRHQACQPFYYAVVIEPDSIACELLIRTKNRLNCECIQYADLAQRNCIIQCMDTMIEGLGIRF